MEDDDKVEEVLEIISSAVEYEMKIKCTKSGEITYAIAILSIEFYGHYKYLLCIYSSKLQYISS